MNPDQARDALRTALSRVAPEADLDEVADGERMRDSLDLDSMDFLALLEQIATLTGIDVPERDYDQVQSVAGFVTYLTRATAPATG